MPMTTVCTSCGIPCWRARSHCPRCGAELPRGRYGRLRAELEVLRAEVTDELDALDRGVVDNGVEASRANSRIDALLRFMREQSAEAGLPEPADAPCQPASETAVCALAGIPAGHPESLTAELDEADEELLGALAAETWPGDEYEAITAEGDAL